MTGMRITTSMAITRLQAGKKGTFVVPTPNPSKRKGDFNDDFNDDFSK